MPLNIFLRAVAGLKLSLEYLYKCPSTLFKSLNFFKYGKQAISLWLLYNAIPHLNKTYDIVHCQFGTQSFRGVAFRDINSPNAKLITTFKG